MRARRGFIADLVDGLAAEMGKPHILSIASGHLREALLCSTIKRRRFSRYIALDSDPESLEEVSRCYSAYGVQTCNASIRRLFSRHHDLGLFDLVYSTGLYDYLQMPAAQRLTASLFNWLRPRGRLVIANFLPGILDLGYMESYMAWKLIFRTRQEMLEIAEEIPLADIRDIRIFAEDNQNIIFLQSHQALNRIAPVDPRPGCGLISSTREGQHRHDPKSGGVRSFHSRRRHPISIGSVTV